MCASGGSEEVEDCITKHLLVRAGHKSQKAKGTKYSRATHPCIP